MKFIELAYETQPKIWGEEKWIISGHKNAPAKVKNTEETLAEFYRSNRELFGKNLPEEFPLLVKIINTNDDLSIQVHPDDEYANKNENSLGKTECWYIIDAKDTDIIAGQKKITREEVENAVKENNFLEICNLKPIKKDDFFYIPAGCIHAIRKNTSLLEIQQSSDVTYRLYDYNRKDDNGNLRDLHIDKSLDVIDYNYENKFEPNVVYGRDGYVHTELVTSDYFYVDLMETNEELTISTDDEFKMVIALDGPMTVDGKAIKENEGVVILANQNVDVKPEAKIIVSGM